MEPILAAWRGRNAGGGADGMSGVGEGAQGRPAAAGRGGGELAREVLTPYAMRACC